MSNIKLFENRQVRSVWVEAEGKWFFSVQDVVGILTDSADVKQYIKRMLSRDETLKSNWGTICTPVEMQAADGKMRKIQAADAKGLSGPIIEDLKDRAGFWLDEQLEKKIMREIGEAG
ncbi:MAG TPA: hypothetical protein PKD24_02455 [Pyrinomonadaceae bacterium]|nr:hypothetical protein [Pyrinomonadaceae bacterium]HMP63979.1 hypothetical protein [Pyrinomonadaceae bacterium]